MPGPGHDFETSGERPKDALPGLPRADAEKVGDAEASASVQAFCEQIRKDAQKEIGRIFGRADLSAKRRTEEAEKEAVEVIRQIRDAARAQVKSVEARMMSGVSLEIKKTLLRVQGEIIEDAFARVRARLRELRGTDQYANSLKEWSAQGVMALGEKDCVLAPGVEDRGFFTPGFVQEVKEIVARRGGRNVELTLSHDLLPDGYGVRVYCGKGRMLFDNTLDARMERLADELKTIVAREAFTEVEEKKTGKIGME